GAKRKGGEGAQQRQEKGADTRHIKAPSSVWANIMQRCAGVKRKEFVQTPSQSRTRGAQCAPRQRAASNIGHGGDEEWLHEVLTVFETALEWAAHFDGTPSGQRQSERQQPTPKQGVDESQNRATMCGSLGRNCEGMGIRR